MRIAMKGLVLTGFLSVLTGMCGIESEGIWRWIFVGMIFGGMGLMFLGGGLLSAKERKAEAKAAKLAKNRNNCFHNFLMADCRNRNV